VAPILKDVSAIIASRQVALNAVQLQQVIDQLDGGGQVPGLEGPARAATQGGRNARVAKASLQVAWVVLRELANLLGRALELCREAQGEAVDGLRREALGAELQDILRTIADIDSNTKVNGIRVFGADLLVDLGGAGSLEIHVDALDPIGSMTLSLGTPAQAASAAGAVEAAQRRAAASGARLGTSLRDLDGAMRALGIQAESMAAVQSRLRTAQRASEVVNLVKWQLVHWASTGGLDQANRIKLLRRRILPPL